MTAFTGGRHVGTAGPIQGRPTIIRIQNGEPGISPESPEKPFSMMLAARDHDPVTTAAMPLHQNDDRPCGGRATHRFPQTCAIVAMRGVGNPELGQGMAESINISARAVVFIGCHKPHLVENGGLKPDRSRVDLAYAPWGILLWMEVDVGFDPSIILTIIAQQHGPQSASSS